MKKFAISTVDLFAICPFTDVTYHVVKKGQKVQVDDIYSDGECWVSVSTWETYLHARIENLDFESVKNENPNCGCDYEKSTFFQNHGCCEYCFYVGE